MAVQIVARIILGAWLVSACVLAAFAHDKPLRGRGNAWPVVYTAIIEAVLIYLSIWGV